MNPEEIKFWEEVAQLVNPVVPVNLEYRLYYNDLGEITSCSMSNHEESGNYIVVTKTEYDRYFDYRIVKQQLVKIDRDSGYRVQLQKSITGFPVVKDHAGLLIEETYTNIEHYEYRNN
jgi:hypothetical protein